MLYWQDEFKANPHEDNLIDKKYWIKENKIKKNICKANYHWNDWKLQFYSYKFERVDPKKRYCRKNPFCSSTHKFYIKYGNNAYPFVVHYKLKPIYYVVLLKHKYHSAIITLSISPSTVLKINSKASTASSTSVKNK